MSRFDDTRSLIELVLLVLAISIAFVLAFLFMPKKGDVVVYNCSIAEISPDIPLEVKEKCRKLRAENILQKPK
jgi:uncharacterized membrane protein YgaE (UPF0421/DUF939 family)